MPNYDLGDRKLGVLPNVPSPRIRIAEMGAEVASAGRAVAHSIDRIAMMQKRNAEAQERIDTREANYRIAEGVDWFKNRWNGQEVQNPQTGEWEHVPGVIDRTWQEMESDGTNPMEEMERLKTEFRETDIYLKMTPQQRQIFDRNWTFKENEFHRAAQIRHIELQKKRRDDENARLNLEDDTYVVDGMGMSSPDFEERVRHSAARKVFRKYGSAVTSDVNPEDPNFNIANIAIKGMKEDDPRAQALRSQMEADYDNLQTAYRKARVVKLAELAKADVPNADAFLDLARETLETQMEGVIPEVETKALGSEIDKAKQYLTKTREAKDLKDKTKTYDELKVGVVEKAELALLDSEKVLSEALDYDGFEKQVTVANLTAEQKSDLLKRYRTLVNYQDKYINDLAKYEAKQKEAADKERNEHGYIDKRGIFIPASSFVSKTEMEATIEFGEGQALWQDPKTALLKVEAARMAGRLSESGYKRYRSYGEMLMRKEAEAAWLKCYPQLKLDVAANGGYGLDEDDLTPQQKEYRKRYNSRYPGTPNAFTGVYARKAGSERGEDDIDWLADSLSHDVGEDEEEELVPAETMAKVYDTVVRFATAGVDPTDALREIIAPSIQKGVSMDIEKRVSSPDFFKEVLGKLYDEMGSGTTLRQNLTDQRIKSAEARKRQRTTPDEEEL